MDILQMFQISLFQNFVGNSNRMFKSLVFIIFKPNRQQVRSIFFHFSLSVSFLSQPSMKHQIVKAETHISEIPNLEIPKSIPLKCSHLLNKKDKSFSDLNEILFRVFQISPEIARKFIGHSELKPDDVFELLMGCNLEFCTQHQIESRKVLYIFELFKWASNQTKGFQHLPGSYDVMATMLIRGRLLNEAEFVISFAESRGVLVNSYEVLNGLIMGYLNDAELDKAIFTYDRMRTIGLVPSLSCYRVLLDALVEASEFHEGLRVCLDFLETRFAFSDVELDTFDKVIKLLCKDKHIQQARNVVKKIVHMGSEPGCSSINAIASGYCRKNDFENILSFYNEINRVPDILIGNRIILRLCINFGVKRADMYMHELMDLGFCSDAKTFGILIGFSCREGKLKNAFIYLSEILSRGLKPDAYSYNAIISGLFKAGMWRHAREILVEMSDMDISRNFSTFRVLLAGYCNDRQFEETKSIIREMVNYDLVKPSSLEDPLSNAFMILGFDPLVVRVKRDNDIGLVKAEFFDNLGNGLYLDANQEKYEETLSRVLEDSMVPEFNSLVMEECDNGHWEIAISMLEVMAQWGQELSLSAFTALVKCLCVPLCQTKKLMRLLETVPDLVYHLDVDTINLVIQSYCKNGLTDKGHFNLKSMHRRHLTVKNETYASVINGFCKEKNLKGALEFWNLARKDKWSPQLKDFRYFVGFLCSKGMLKEALELFVTVVSSFSDLKSDIFRAFVSKLCVSGNTSFACTLLEELQWDSIMDRISYSDLIRGFFNEKRYPEGLAIYDVMLVNNLTPCLDVSIALLPQLYRAGCFEKADALKDACLKLQPSSSTPLPIYTDILNGFCEIGMVRESIFFLRDFSFKGITPNGEFCNAMVRGLVKANDFSKISELLGFMVKNNMNFSLSTFRKLACLMCVEGKFIWALRLKEFTLRERPVLGIVVYNILIFYLLTKGRWNCDVFLINALLSNLHENGFVPDEVTYDFLVYGFFKCKDVPRSLHYMSTMISKELRPSDRTLRIAIRSFIDDGDLERALALSRVMEQNNRVHGSIVQNALVEGLLSRGKILEAENFLNRMDSNDLVSCNISYDNLIKTFYLHGRLNMAVALLNRMLKKGNTPIGSSYSFVIRGLCELNELDQAMNFYNEVLGRKLKLNMDAWAAFIDVLCRNGLMKEAEGVLLSMVGMGEIPTREMYQSVINRHQIENNFEKALEILKEMQKNGYRPDFDIHWSLICSLSGNNDKFSGKNNRGFLSRLLSGG